ncbi:hypothetical protein FA95DRAFT_936609 [Auriscalpium vulgare]|uniref:Uncharacterized protein n=1 Tax=Auriscalpium vulgare TaxID=40419 RepID=A0ACB8SBG6_9AGAM|nr:hypothetical protein FA95DRAFT_936609 [Auriscalpium vulgare]
MGAKGAASDSPRSTRHSTSSISSSVPWPAAQRARNERPLAAFVTIFFPLWSCARWRRQNHGVQARRVITVIYLGSRPAGSVASVASGGLHTLWSHQQFLTFSQRMRLSTAEADTGRHRVDGRSPPRLRLHFSPVTRPPSDSNFPSSEWDSRRCFLARRRRPVNIYCVPHKSVFLHWSWIGRTNSYLPPWPPPTDQDLSPQGHEAVPEHRLNQAGTTSYSMPAGVRWRVRWR